MLRLGGFGPFAPALTDCSKPPCSFHLSRSIDALKVDYYHSLTRFVWTAVHWQSALPIGSYQYQRKGLSNSEAIEPRMVPA